jgi:uncharacterized SAM-dependent methyltransferase
VHPARPRGRPLHLDPDGRLAPGEDIEGRLRADLAECDVVVALLTPRTPQSRWVQFELGAAWALGKRIIPLWADGLADGEFPGPLQRKVGASSADRSGLGGVVEQVARCVGASAKPAPVVTAHVDAFVANWQHRYRRPADAGRERLSLVQQRFVEIFCDKDDKHSYLADEFWREVTEEGALTELHRYWGPDETEAWKKLCEAPLYRPYSASVRFLNRHVEQIVSAMRQGRDPEIDFVCLGVGTGRRRSCCFRSCSGSGATRPTGSTSSPVDVSIHMMLESVEHYYRRFAKEKDRIRFCGILGDFRRLDAVKHIFERPNPRLFALLGNSLGNYREDRLLRSVRDAMRPSDFLLVDSELSPPADGRLTNQAINERLEGSYHIPEYLAFCVAPLLKLGITEEDGVVRPDVRPWHQHLPDVRARTVMQIFEFTRNAPTVKFRGKGHEFRQGERITLGYSIKYEQESLQALLAGAGFDVAQSFVDRDGFYGMFLCRPRGAGTPPPR